MNGIRTISTDILVVGAGSAGLRAALAAAQAGSRVLVANKGPAGKSGITPAAAGGMQAPFHPDDSAEQYFRDIMQFGYGLSDQNLAQALAENACQCVLDLARLGVRFSQDAEGRFVLRQFPGQSRPRGLAIKGGGVGLAGALVKACRACSDIEIMDDFFVTGLIKGKSSGEAAIAGAMGIDLRTGDRVCIAAKAVILASGGCAWLWEVNDSPADAVGEGIIYAYRAGAPLVDMEMVLFYPSVIVWPPSLQGAFVHYEFLDSNILDGNVYDRDNRPVLPKPLPVRDAAMRIMAQAIGAGRGMPHGGLEWYVGNSPKAAGQAAKFLKTAQYDYLRLHGVEPATDRMEVAPGAHYVMGGVQIDEWCRTSVPGLFAAPECAGNVDGANRLAGNGITATQVFGARAGQAAHNWCATRQMVPFADASVEEEAQRIARKLGAKTGDGSAAVISLRNALRSAVQRYAGVSRDAEGLKHLMKLIDDIRKQSAQITVPETGPYNQLLMEALQLDVLCDAAYCVAGSALLRQESRGHHFRADFPQTDAENWTRHTRVSPGPDGPCFAAMPAVSK